MNDDQLDDLKQFITATVSQTEARLTERIDGIDTRLGSLEQKVGTLEQKVDVLEQKVDDGFAAIGEILADTTANNDAHNEEVAEQLTDHAQRLVRLEQQAV